MSDNAPRTPHIDAVRTELLATLQALRDRENQMDVDRARAVAQVAGVLVDSAKVEVEYIKVTGQDNAPFLEAPPTAPSPPADNGAGPVLAGMPVSKVHRLAG